MLDGQLIIDAVVHPWNMSPENQNPAAMPQVEAVYASHKLSFDEANSHFILQPDEFYRDLSFDVIGRAEFAESPVDFAVLHSLPNLGFGLGPITLPEKCVAFRDAYPDRVKMYGTVGTPIVASAIDEIKRQIDEYGIDARKFPLIKLRPTKWDQPFVVESGGGLPAMQWDEWERLVQAAHPTT